MYHISSYLVYSWSNKSKVIDFFITLFVVLVTFVIIFMDDMISSFGINDFTNEIKEVGNNILNYIKKDAKYPITTIIMVTANKGKEEEKYLKYGFSDYITKPIIKGMLDKILRKYFNK